MFGLFYAWNCAPKRGKIRHCNIIILYNCSIVQLKTLPGCYSLRERFPGNNNCNPVTVIDDLTYYTLSIQTQTRSNSKRQKERKLNKKKT